MITLFGTSYAWNDPEILLIGGAALVLVLLLVLILRAADTLKLFDMPFTMTRGGPGSATEFIAVLIERVGNRQFDIGLASAQSIIMLAITIVLARAYIPFFYREVR